MPQDFPIIPISDDLAYAELDYNDDGIMDRVLITTQKETKQQDVRIVGGSVSINRDFRQGDSLRISVDYLIGEKRRSVFWTKPMCLL